jgi:murein DD-endopeptidase MepM/ murein hydrolase activator NlpD
VDIANREGTPIPAFKDGVVTSVNEKSFPGDKGFGNHVTIVDKNGNKHHYSHLLKPAARVGMRVKKGQIVGLMGRTGSAYSPSGGDATHLDYRISDINGSAVDPMSHK